VIYYNLSLNQNLLLLQNLNEVLKFNKH